MGSPCARAPGAQKPGADSACRRAENRSEHLGRKHVAHYRLTGTGPEATDRDGGKPEQTNYEGCIDSAAIYRWHYTYELHTLQAQEGVAMIFAYFTFERHMRAVHRFAVVLYRSTRFSDSHWSPPRQGTIVYATHIRENIRSDAHDMTKRLRSVRRLVLPYSYSYMVLPQANALFPPPMHSAKRRRRRPVPNVS
ncbi:hypothetical protein EVAR_82235_1 [Eumeta japonica]|uniref:Uncharacterized protein n=1 Tax=Eumeta variegata TaxID=151549 RepID=A0A4C1W173_EUMVA|nr:hypothetical protein EVAR_82235_1 [Eumeta japonica]